LWTIFGSSRTVWQSSVSMCQIPMNKADQKRLDIIHRLPCMACVQEGCQQPNKTEAHHLVDKGYRKHSGGHQATIPLCGWHHRAEPAWGSSLKGMAGYYGPSMKLESKRFAKKYGTQRKLLAQIDSVISGKRSEA
jgi:hypothetical protein